MPKYYITGDGPSHTYNAKVLFDVLKNDHREFYREFYTINRNLDPNWTAQLLLGVFLQFLPYWLADKFTQIAYLILFAFAFRYLIKSIRKDNSFLSLLFFPFCFTLPFQQGFYNYSLGIALALFCIGYFIKIKNSLQPIQLLFLSILLLATTVSHGMAVGHALFLIGLLFIIENRNCLLQKETINNAILIVLAGLPSVIIIAFFTIKKGFSTTPHSLSILEKLKNFFSLYCCQSTRNTEFYPAVLTGILILLFFSIGVLKKQILFKNIFLATTVFALFSFVSYVRCPNDIGGAGSIDIRLAFLPPMFLLIALASMQWSRTHRNLFILLSSIVQFTFLIIRFPFVTKASAEGEKIMQASPYIKDESTVLVLHYNDYGKDKIFEKDNSFLHFADYYGAQKNKHLINILNYEADLIYFPVNWHTHTNPRKTINTMYQGNYPPCGNMVDYEHQIQKPVNYVVLYNKTHETDSCTTAIQKHLDSAYTVVYKNDVVKLYYKINP